MKNYNYIKENSGKFIQMYRFLLITLITIATFNPAKAIVGNYTFASSTGNYLSITGTTLFTGAWDDGSSALLTIPFTFTYNNVAYTTVGVNSNGFITMGAVPTTVYCGLQTSAANSIAGYGTDLVGSTTSTIQYTTRGTTPNRQFVVQWADCDHYNNANANHWTFQIILNETTNTVQVVWGTSTDATTMGANTCTDAATESGNVGLVGANTQDFNIRSVTNAANTWTSSASGSAITNVCNMSSTNIPSSGLTYTWTPAPSVAMSFTSSTTAFVNNGQAVSRSTTSNQILQIQVLTTGSLSPFSLTNISLSTAGCTNPATDITNAKVFFTGISNVFASTTQFGSTVTSPNGAYSVSGSVALSEGTNYFWVTYDITSTATIGNILSGCCSQLVGSGTMGSRTPSVTCPSGSQTISQVGSWALVTSTPPHSNGGGMLLLSDGTILCKTFAGGTDGYGNLWEKLTPNANGSYINGTWSTIAPMINTRLYFSSQVLKDGRVYVAGGEYGTGLQQGETYNPLTNVWTAAPSPGVNISDANSEILPDGRILQALVAGGLTGTDIYNPATNSYSAGPTALGIHNESAWIKLQDNSILYVNRLATSSERYIPSTNTWVNDAVVPVQLYDSFGDETGGALLLPDGRAFFLGATGHTAYYTPSGSSSPGLWSAGPDVPSAKGAPDAPIAMMVNGKILCAVSPVPTSANHFPTPTSFYEFDYLTNTFTLINAPGGGTSISISSYVTNMLDLPDGTVLYSRQNSAQYYVYTPGSGPLAAGKPTIANITQTSCTTFNITGTLFNGISEGACYGDDWQMASNYPLVRLTSGSNVYYTRTANWNRTGVMTGALADTAQFTTPSGLAAGTYSLVVVANGISSDPVSFVFSPVPTLGSSLTPPAICTNTTFTYTPTSASSGATFTWTRAAVAGISNAAITIPQTTNPNEVLINTTSSPVSVVYSYTISASGCSSNVQPVTVVVNPIPVAATITTGSATTFCNGGNVLLIGNNNNGTWSVVGGTTSTLTATTSGDYFVTNSNSCGSAVSNHIIVTVNPNPSPSITGNTAFCSGSSTILNAGAGYSGYSWSTSATTQTISANTAGTFTVTVTNTNGCSGSTSATTLVNANPSPSISGNTSFCSGSSTTLDAGAGYSNYNWSTGATTQTISASTAGTFTVTVTNANGCSGSTSATTIVNGNPSPSISGNTSFCSGSSTTLDAGAGYSGYSWSTGATTQTISASTTGTFTVTVTNPNGCSGSTSATTIVNANPSPSISGNTAFCSGSSTTLDAGAGYSGYSWSTGVTTQTINANTAGTFTVTVTNANGCSGSTSATTIVNANPSPSISGNTAFCSGSSTTLDAGAGYSGYSWSTGATTQTINANTTGTFTVTVTNANGCSGSTSATTIVNANPSPSITGSTSFCTGNSTTLDAGSGYTIYNWSTGATSQTISVNNGSTFTVTVTNASGCTGSASATTIVNPLPNVTASNVSGCAGTSIVLSGTPVGGTWSVANPYIGSSTTYTHTYTDGNGCSNTSAAATITVNPLPTVSFSGLASSYSVSAAAATLTGSPTGGTFSGPGISGNTFTPSLAGVGGPYTITYSYTNGNGCTNSSSLQTTVTNCAVPAMPGSITTIGGAVKICPGDSKSYKIAAVSGASSYTWTPPTGGVITSGQGTVQIAISYNANFTASGTLCVTANNNCGSSLARTLTITRNTPATPGVITGLASGVCSSTGVPYSVTNVAGITYSWSFNVSTASIVTGQGSNAITANYLITFTTGHLDVTAGNACGTSVARNLTVNAVPATPASITGATLVCANQFGVPYSISPIASATSYTWTGMTGSHISDGVTTSTGTVLTTTSTSVTVNFGNTSGKLNVKANNACGVGANKSLTIGFNCRIKFDASIQPNPSSGDFVFYVQNGLNEKTTITVLDLAGRKIKQISSTNSNDLLKISGLSPGIYSAVVINGEDKKVLKLIKVD